MAPAKAGMTRWMLPPMLLGHLAGCAGAGPPQGAQGVVPAGGADARADVRAAADAWTRGASTRDAGAMADYFAADAFAMYPRPEPTVGREANRAAWAAVFAQPGATHPVTTDTVVVAASGDLAYTAGR
jgi:hypothetical protein